MVLLGQLNKRNMKKKMKILGLLVMLPLLLIQLYTYFFESAGNWLEDYRNYFKVGFLALSIFSSIWLVIISKKEKNWIWFGISTTLLILLLIYLYFALAIINSSY